MEEITGNINVMIRSITQEITDIQSQISELKRKESILSSVLIYLEDAIDCIKDGE